MLKKVTQQEEVKEIIDYIGASYMTTPYMYVNVIKYGLGTDHVSTWIDRGENNRIEGIYLLYYDCIHFYTNDVNGYPVERLLHFIRSTRHKVLMLPGCIGDKIDTELPEYYSERNYIMNMDKVGLKDIVYRGKIAKREDIAEIVDLLMADPEYIDVYDRKVLTDQMYDRFDSRFSRYFVVKMDNKVVATCSTYGEVPGFAILGGVIVHPDYRRRGLASDVDQYACNVLSKEGITCVSFVNYHNTASLALHEKLGAFSIATLAKFVSKTKV